MAILKISDLSVGDWVGIDQAELNMPSTDLAAAYIEKLLKPICVKGISDDSDTVLADIEAVDGWGSIMLKCEYLKPIPITAEILEKNGFVDKGSCLFRYEREWRGDKSAVNICSFDEELWFADFEFRDGRTCMSNIPIFYVNQLQHILRLIGVDKEINL